MPYIKPEDRIKFKEVIEDLANKVDNCGELNYSITKLLHLYLKKKGLKYSNCNEIMGVLNCVTHELYRKVISDYEELKIKENGDV